MTTMTNFDLISDLYLTSLENFTWENKATSLYCIVAGNISADRNILFDFLDELQQYYNMVFFIDGDLEHGCYQGNLTVSYRNLKEGIDLLDNVLFLHENIVILNNVTIIGANGWTTFDFTNKASVNSTIDYISSTGLLTEDYCNDIFKSAVSDQHYMYNGIDTCQTMPECHNLLLVTNSVPNPEFINHNPDYDGTVLGDTTGNNGIINCLSRDKQHKVKTWVFGKFPENIDYTINNIKYISNPGVDVDPDIYFPKRIEI